MDLKALEEKWQKHWEREGVFRFDFKDTKKEIISFDVPPPYASGALHCGHAVHYTHQDFMARYQRMRGKNVFFPLCFDVNGIPIEERVERERGITRKDIGRQEFIELCSRFADENIENMTKQYRRLGHSADETIFYRTDSKEYRRITQISFLKLYEKGHIYKGEHPINWCPRCMTAMADAEVDYKGRTTDLHYLKFHLPQEHPGLEEKKNVGRDETGQYLEIATTRPELLATCQAVALHPEDERAKALEGQQIQVPLFGKKVKIILDDSVDPEYGSGTLMVCTIGDKEDLAKVFKHKLPLEIAIEEDGTLNELAGPYKGMKIADARKKTAEDLEAAGLRIKHEPTEGNVGICWRCKTPVEFVKTPQWFLRLLDQKEDVLRIADEQKWFPEFMKVRLRDWVDSLEWDWVLSRQRYFATAIPVWECTKEECDGVVVANEDQMYVDPTVDDPPVDACPKCGGELKGCEDVFDTWMDSSVSPLFNTFWHRDEGRGAGMHQRMYPMTVRPQSHDIIRTWLFYTILRCNLLTGKTPFTHVMMGGFILDPQGHPMHKSRGNVIDPMDVIAEHGAEALRYYAALCDLGEDNAIRDKDFVRGRRFAMKYHNVQRFLHAVLKSQPPLAIETVRLNPVDAWLINELSDTIETVTAALEEYAYSRAVRALEGFLWHTFADHYIELVKARAYRTDEDGEAARAVLYHAGWAITRMLSPFFPHVTEEAYHELYAKHIQSPDDEAHRPTTIGLCQWPRIKRLHEKDAPAGAIVKEAAAAVRNWKSENSLALNAPLAYLQLIPTQATAQVQEAALDLKGATNAETIEITDNVDGLQKRPLAVLPVHSVLGPTFKKQAPLITKALAGLDPEEAAASLGENGKLTVNTPEGDIDVPQDAVTVRMGHTIAGAEVEVIEVPGAVVALRRE
jgi:valyl-tRNA synthetase